jgi:hypothetical protein
MIDLVDKAAVLPGGSLCRMSLTSLAIAGRSWGDAEAATSTGESSALAGCSARSRQAATRSTTTTLVARGRRGGTGCVPGPLLRPSARCWHVPSPLPSRSLAPFRTLLGSPGLPRCPRLSYGVLSAQALDLPIFARRRETSTCSRRTDKPVLTCYLDPADSCFRYHDGWLSVGVLERVSSEASSTALNQLISSTLETTLGSAFGGWLILSPCS